MQRKTLDDLNGAEPLTGIVAMKEWNDGKQCWVGTVCQAFRYADGTEGIVVYDVGRADTQVEIDDWARTSIQDKPWEKTVADKSHPT